MNLGGLGKVFMPIYASVATLTGDRNFHPYTPLKGGEGAKTAGGEANYNVKRGKGLFLCLFLAGNEFGGAIPT